MKLAINQILSLSPRLYAGSTIHYGGYQQHQTTAHDYHTEREPKSKSHSSKIEDVLPFHSMNQSWNPSNGSDYSSHLLSAGLSASLPISIQHILKYSESIKKESASAAAANNVNTNDLLGLKINQHHLNHQHHHSFMNNGNDNNIDHHHSSSINIPSHNSMLHHSASSNAASINMKPPTMVPLNNGSVKVKKERKKSVKQPNAVKKPKKKKPPKERKPRPKVSRCSVKL